MFNECKHTCLTEYPDSPVGKEIAEEIKWQPLLGGYKTKLTNQYKRNPQTLKNIIRSKNRKTLSKKSYLTKNYKHNKSQKILTKISKSKSFRRPIK